jgi:hemoglobin-like flavoprotein
LRGFVHAHVGWLFRHDQRGSRARYATDLLADPVIRFVDRTFVLWALGGLALAFGLGVVIGGSLTAGLTGLLQGKRARRQSDPARPLRTSSERADRRSGHARFWQRLRERRPRRLSRLPLVRGSVRGAPCRRDCLCADPVAQELLTYVTARYSDAEQLADSRHPMNGSPTGWISGRPLALRPARRDAPSMSLDLEALETSFDLVAPHGDELIDTFYARLFATAPAVRRVFAGADLRRQKTMLLTTLVLLRKWTRSSQAARAWCPRRRRRAKPDHYPVVGQAPIGAMAEIAGKRIAAQVRSCLGGGVRPRHRSHA